LVVPKGCLWHCCEELWNVVAGSFGTDATQDFFISLIDLKKGTLQTTKAIGKLLTSVVGEESYKTEGLLFEHQQRRKKLMISNCKLYRINKRILIFLLLLRRTMEERC